MQINQVQYSLRKYLIPKISNHKNLHSFSTNVYKNYCKTLSTLHVLPDFYIIGGQKCGTTSLYMYLIDHPEIFSPPVKDIRFFDKYFKKGIDWYKMYFPLTSKKFFVETILKKKFLTYEATERYLDHPHAATRINKITPNAKFIILLRNPIDRAYSHYNMIKNRGDEKFKESLSFEDAILIEEERLKGKFQKMIDEQEYYSDTYFRNGYLNRGIYVEKLKRWFSMFDKNQFYIIQSEEFLKNSEKIFQEVLEFLEISKWSPKEFVQYKKLGNKRKEMKPETRKKLIEFFKPHNEKLYEFLGRKFDWDK